jgi:uncharacterized protein
MVEYYKGGKTWEDSVKRIFPEFADKPFVTKTITFVVTEQCNMRCTYCYQTGKNNNRMTREVAFKAIDTILDQNKMRGYLDPEETPGVILDFIGGEPLLEIELIEDIVDYFRWKAFELNHPWLDCYMFSFSSNGLLYFDENVQRFLAKNDGRVSLAITIDGDKTLHDACRVDIAGQGTYDRVSKAIKDLVAKGRLKSTKVTIAPGNVAYVKDAILHLFDLGLTDIHANCVFEEGWEKKHARELYRQMVALADVMIEKKLYETKYVSLFSEIIGQPMDPAENGNWCGGDGKMLAIGPDGRLYPCLRYMSYSLESGRDPLVIGDIECGIYADCPELDRLKSITRRSQSTDECFNCPVASGCAWCTAYNYDKFGDFNKRATFICVMHKARVLANHYYWNKLGIPYELHLGEDDIAWLTEEGN